MSDPIGYNGSFIEDVATYTRPTPGLVTHKALGFYKEGDEVLVMADFAPFAWKRAVVTKAFDGEKLFVIGDKLGRYAVMSPERILPAKTRGGSDLKILPQRPTAKDTNPKDAVGIKKAPSSVVPRAVVQETGLAMLEGALKYGRHNYRVAGVRASVYFDAANRHLDLWWEGQDIDPDSGLPHITKAIACLTVIRDAVMNDKWVDDRPPPMKNQGWLAELNKRAAELIERFPNPKPAFTKENKA